jgi:hypothetical protein
LILVETDMAQQVPVERHHIRFSTVEIREFAVTVGDHPHARDSCPITLDWQHAATYSMPLDDYENKRFFVRSSCCSTRQNLKRLSVEQRRLRVKETSRIPNLALREMELAVAMNRLQHSMDGINEFWRKMDGTNSNNVHQEQHPAKERRHQQVHERARQEQSRIRKGGGGGSKKASSKRATLQKVLSAVTERSATNKATTPTAAATTCTTTTTGSKQSKKSSKQSHAQISDSATKSKQTRSHKRMHKKTIDSTNGGINSGSNHDNKESTYIDVITWRRVNRALF